MWGQSLRPVPVIDGCGIPIWGILANLAQGWATLATTDEGRRLFAAMQAEPFLVAGTGRMCTRIMEAWSGLAVKTGAEGVFSVSMSSLGWRGR